MERHELELALEIQASLDNAEKFQPGIAGNSMILDAKYKLEKLIEALRNEDNQ